MNKIPLHSKELQTIGIEIRSFSDLEKAPRIPHRNDHFMLLLQQDGFSIWEVDFKEWTLKQSALCFVAPGQVHRYISSKHTEGWLIFITIEMIPADIRATLDASMFYKQAIPINKTHSIFAFTELVQQFLSDTDHPLRNTILSNLSNALFGIFTVAFMPHLQQRVGIFSHKYQIVSAFKNLIKQQFKEIKQVKEYANQLNITPLYLNEVTRGATGFAASYWIQKEILLEAQRQLFYTDRDVKEIAFALGYEDYAYFSRFFKKNTGITPSKFRENNHDLSNNNH